MTYKVTLSTPIPAKDLWTFLVYDNQTRSILETDQVTGGLDSNSKGVKLNDDGSATVYFGPKAPEGQEGNWGCRPCPARDTTRSFVFTVRLNHDRKNLDANRL